MNEEMTLVANKLKPKLTTLKIIEILMVVACVVFSAIIIIKCLNIYNTCFDEYGKAINSQISSNSLASAFGNSISIGFVNLVMIIVVAVFVSIIAFYIGKLIWTKNHMEDGEYGRCAIHCIFYGIAEIVIGLISLVLEALAITQGDFSFGQIWYLILFSILNVGAGVYNFLCSANMAKLSKLKREEFDKQNVTF